MLSMTADIKAGDYVASTGVKSTDGKIHAIEVRIFPEAARGTGEGQYPWDLMPDSIMTNATVGKVDQAPQGRCDHAGWACETTRYLTARDTTGFRRKWRRVMQQRSAR
jgi:hypothetical protein